MPDSCPSAAGAGNPPSQWLKSMPLPERVDGAIQLFAGGTARAACRSAGGAGGLTWSTGKSNSWLETTLPVWALMTAKPLALPWVWTATISGACCTSCIVRQGRSCCGLCSAGSITAHRGCPLPLCRPNSLPARCTLQSEVKSWKIASLLASKAVMSRLLYTPQTMLAQHAQTEQVGCHSLVEGDFSRATADHTVARIASAAALQACWR